MTITQRDLHQQLRTDLLATRQRIADVVRPLNDAQVRQRTEPNGWSAGEVLEHLCVSDEIYEGPIRTLLASARADAGAAARAWKPTIFGNMLASSLARPMKLKAPKSIQPGPTPRGGVVEAFLARELNAVTLMDDSTSFDWRALRMVSPLLPSFMPKFNLGDVFKIHVVHVARHAKQIERVLEKL